MLDRLKNIDLQYAWESLSAYLISPGFSLWSFSPVLLLGLPGTSILLRARQYRQVLTVVAMLVGMGALARVVRRILLGGGPAINRNTRTNNRVSRRLRASEEHS